ncbi:hypothetical protein LCGC14_2616780 [marine sediment metagenome]|uniref:Uncharacterized protein n=1 Tax=marine sediment metagenome TaxID=412755 RepID=A0A0F9CFC6_9ZZZZ
MKACHTYGRTVEVVGVDTPPKGPNETMRVVCAWCGRELRPGKGQLSHGICLPCAKALDSRCAEACPSVD